jgi:hypothetical protein
MFRECLSAHLRVLFLSVCLLGWANSYAQSSQVNATCTNAPSQSGLLDEVHTIADPSQGVPVECRFDVSVASTYRVTLTDLGVVIGSNPVTPAPLASVKLGVTRGSTVVGTVLSAPGDMQFDATPGTYVIRVVGVPADQLGSGQIGIAVRNVADSTLLASFSAALVKPIAGLLENENVVDDSFTVSSDGSYVVSLSDLKLPQALPTLALVITTLDGTFITNPPLLAAGSATVTLQHGVTYRIVAAGQTDGTVNAGLFSASVTPSGGGAPVFSAVAPIGAVAPLAIVTLNSGGTYTLSTSDLTYPAALTGLGAVVATNGQVVAQLTSAGSSPAFTAGTGSYQVFALATAATTGSYAVSLTQQGGSPALSVARAVTATGGATPSVYSYDTNVPTAGNYAFNLADFGFPSSFASLKTIAVQNGAMIGQPLSISGTQNLAAAAGPMSLLVFAQPGAAGSLFGVDLTASGAASTFATTQGVGTLFSARQVSITSAGNYAVNVGDVKFPAALSTFAVIVTQGSTQFGSIYGGGAFLFPATPGNYFVNFIAKPNGTDQSGTYSMSVAPGPNVKLHSDVTTVASGGVVHLDWTSENATDCTASGGWSGSQLLSGTAVSGALKADTTFTLTCAGQGTTAAQTVTVSVTAPQTGGGGGGGGSISVDLALLLLGLVVHRSARRNRHAFVMHGA